MNRRSTALIVILSLLAIFVTNTLAQAATEDPANLPEEPADKPATKPADKPGDKSAEKSAPEVPSPTPGAPPAEDGSGAPEGSTPGNSGATYPVIGAIATAVIANFF
ncbi:hypothetical protein B9Z55_002786 [Caenorhabditis nigoni]|uniref:Uncharacterized protein n=1 Tax=Caenorhabditis nigoni TaxID=1611254 RepID=A0A2G5VME6_9PELO|nr:hypothetical protein B9Z55_002786 [Caenorhabditis nigoni]